MYINGEDRKISFGMNQSILYCELRGISLTQMNKDLSKLADGTGSELRDLIWSALKDGARREKKEFKYDCFDVGDWMEDMKQEDIEKAMKSLMESLPTSTKKKR